MTKRKAVRAWAWGIENSDGPGEGNWVTWEGADSARRKIDDFVQEDLDNEQKPRAYRVVELVPRNRHAEKVLRSVLYFHRHAVGTFAQVMPLAIRHAVAAYEKARRK